MAKKFVLITNYAAGQYNLFHEVGDIVEVEESVAQRMQETGHGIESTKDAFDKQNKKAEPKA